MNPFHVFYYALDGEIVHLCDTKSVREPTLCGLTLAIQRTEQWIDAPLCQACYQAKEARRSDPLDELWRQRLQRKVNRYIQNRLKKSSGRRGN